MRLGVLSLSGAAGEGAAPDRSDAAESDRDRIAEAIDAFIAA